MVSNSRRCLSLGGQHWDKCNCRNKDPARALVVVIKPPCITFADDVFCHPRAATVGSTPVIMKGKKYMANSILQVLKGAEFVKPYTMGNIRRISPAKACRK